MQVQGSSFSLQSADLAVDHAALLESLKMKKLLTAAFLAFFWVATFPSLPGRQPVAWAQKKNDDNRRKKDQPGPPVVKDKPKPPPPPPRSKKSS